MTVSFISQHLKLKLFFGGGGGFDFGLVKNYYHSITLFFLLMVFRMEHQVVFCMC